MEKTNKIKLPKPKKGQKCWGCKKEIKRAFCWDGLHFWHEKCLEKKAIKNYLNLLKGRQKLNLTKKLYESRKIRNNNHRGD